HIGRQAGHRDHAIVVGKRDHVVTLGGVDDNRVRCSVAPARAAGQVDVDFVEVGAAEIVDGDGVGAAQGLEVDRFDPVQVHHDIGDIAGHQHAAAVGRDVDLL